MRPAVLVLAVAAWPAAAGAACSFFQCVYPLPDSGVGCSNDHACQACDPQCCGCGGNSGNCYPADNAGLCGDGSVAHDGGLPLPDAGNFDGGGGDAGLAADSGIGSDSGATDAGPGADAGGSGDGSPSDSGTSGDGGEVSDGGYRAEDGTTRPFTVGCGCGTGGAPLAAFALLLALRRRRIK